MRLEVKPAFLVFTSDELHFAALGPVRVLVGLACDLLAILGRNDFSPGLHLSNFLVGGLADIAVEDASD